MPRGSSRAPLSGQLRVLCWGLGQRRSYWRDEVRGMDKGAGLSQGCLLPSPPCGHNWCYIVELALLELQSITGILSQNRQEERLPEQAQPFGLHNKRTCYFRGGDLGSRVPATHAPLSAYSEMGCSGVCLPSCSLDSPRALLTSGTPGPGRCCSAILTRPNSPLVEF